MNALFSQTGLHQLEMTPEQSDFLWFLDQCGLDQHVRALRHTDVFDRVRGLLLNSKDASKLRLEDSIHDNFLLDGWRLENEFGHPAVQRHYARFWVKQIDRAMRSNFIDVKLRQIAKGAPPTGAMDALKLPKHVKDVGSKKALLLMFNLPEGILLRYEIWAQNLCFIDQLIEQKPDYGLLLQLRGEYHREFQSLYKSELRAANGNSRRGFGSNDEREFYKKLFKYKYAVKRDIIRCLCEPRLNK